MKKVLVIDDEQINRLLISSVLKAEKYEVFEASGGKEGIEKAKSLIPDIIVCDMRMPEVDGMEVLDNLRSDENLMSTPFVFLTSNTDAIDEKVALKSGANAYLYKPVSKEKLTDCVKKLIDSSE